MSLLLLFPSAGGAASYTLDATAGTVTVTGQSVTLTVARTLTVTAATVTEAGQSVAVGVTRQIDATAGAVTLTGQSVGLTVQRSLVATAGTVAVSGQSADVTVTRQLTAVAGTITTTGQSVDLTATGPVAYALDVLPATVTVAGQSVDLAVATTGYTGGGDPGYRKAKGPTPQQPWYDDRPEPVEKRVRIQREPVAHDLWVAPGVVAMAGGACALTVERSLTGAVSWEPWEMPSGEMEDALLLAVLA